MNKLSAVARERFRRYLALKTSLVVINKNIQDLQFELKLAMQAYSDVTEQARPKVKRRKLNVTQDQVIDQIRWKVSSISKDHCFTLVSIEVIMLMIGRLIHKVPQKIVYQNAVAF